MPDNSNTSLYRVEIDLSAVEESQQEIEQNFDQLMGRIAGYLGELEGKVQSSFSNMGRYLKDSLTSVDISDIDKGMADAAARTEQWQQQLMQLIAAEMAAASATATLGQQFLNAVQASEQSVEAFVDMIGASGQFSETQSENLRAIVETVGALGRMISALDEAGDEEEEIRQKVSGLTGELQAQISAFQKTTGIGMEGIIGETEDLEEAALDAGRAYYQLKEQYKAALGGDDEERIAELSKEKNAAFERFMQLAAAAGITIPQAYEKIANAAQESKEEINKSNVALEQASEVKPLEATITKEATEGFEELGEEIQEAARKYVEYENRLQQEFGTSPTQQADIPVGKQRYSTGLFNALNEAVGGDKDLLATAIRGAQDELDGLGKKADTAADSVEKITEAAEEIKPTIEAVPEIKPAETQEPLSKDAIDSMFNELLGIKEAEVDLGEVITGEEEAEADLQKLEAAVDSAQEKIEEVGEADAEQLDLFEDTPQQLDEVIDKADELEGAVDSLADQSEQAGEPWDTVGDKIQEVEAKADSVDEALEQIGDAEIAQPVEELKDKLTEAAQIDLSDIPEELRSAVDQGIISAEELRQKYDQFGEETVRGVIDSMRRLRGEMEGTSPDDIDMTISTYDAWAEEIREARKEHAGLNEEVEELATAAPPAPPTPPVPPVGAGDPGDPGGPDDDSVELLRRIVELLEQIATKANEIKSTGGLELVTDEQIQRLKDVTDEIEKARQIKEELDQTKTVQPVEVDESLQELRDTEPIRIEADTSNLDNLNEALEKGTEAVEDFRDEAEEDIDTPVKDQVEGINLISDKSSEAADGIKAVNAVLDQFGVGFPEGAQRVLDGMANAEQGTESLENAFALLINQVPEAKQELIALANQYGNLSITANNSGQIFGSAGQQIGQLGQQAGQARQPIQQAGQALNAQNTALNSLLNRFPQLQPILQALQRHFGNFTTTVNQAAGATANMGRSAQGAFGSGSPLSAFKLGGIISIVDRLFDSVVNLAERGFDRLKDAIENALEQAKEFDSIEASFGGLMAGLFGTQSADPEFALLTKNLSRALAASSRDFSENLGIDVTDTFRRILPRTGDLGVTEELLKATLGLRTAAPDLPDKRAGLAIQELLAGDYQPVRRAFELPVGRLQAAIQEGANARELAEALSGTLATLGLSFEQQSETLIVQLGQIKQEFITLQTIAGLNILEGLEEQMARFRGILEENDEEFRKLITAIGTLFREAIKGGADALQFLFDAGLVDFLTHNILLFTVWTNRIQLVIEFFGLVGQRVAEMREEVVESLVTIIGNTINVIERIGNTIGKIFGAEIFGIEAGTKFKETIIKILQAVKDFGDGLKEAKKTSEDAMSGLIGALFRGAAAATGFFTRVATMGSLLDDVAKGTISFEDAMQQAADAGMEAYNETIDDGERLQGEFNDRLIESAVAAKETTTSILDVSDAASELASALVTVQSNLNQLDELNAERADITEEYDKKILDEIHDFNLENEKLARDRQRRILEIEIDTAEKRVDLETELNRDLNEIAIDAAEERADAFTDLQREYDDIAKDLGREFDDLDIDVGRDAEDAALDRARAIEDIELDSSDKRLDIEKKYRDKLLDIQRQYDFDAEEAIRQNDAVALLRLRRRTQKQLEDAKIQRDRELRDVREDADKKREEAQRDYDRDIEDNRIAEERKREDILLANERKRQDALLEYQRELADIELKAQRERAAKQRQYDQELADLAVAEQRKKEELDRQHQARLDELDIQHAERLRKIDEQLQEELELIERKQQEITDALQEAIDTISEYSVEELQELGDFSEEAAIKILNDLAMVQQRIDQIVATYSNFGRNLFRGIGGRPGAPPPRRQPGYGGDGTPPVRGYARGGKPPTNEPFLVGEPLNGNKPNPEVISSPSPLNVTPLSDFLEGMFMRNMVPQGGAQTTNIYHETYQADINMYDPTGFTLQQQEQLKQIVGELLKEGFRGQLRNTR